MAGYAAEACAKYRQVKDNEGFAPHLKESILKDAIRLWNLALGQTAPPEQRASLHKNVGIASLALANVLKQANVRTSGDATLVRYYLLEAMSYLLASSAEQAGMPINVDKRDSVAVHLEEAFGKYLEVVMLDASLQDRLSLCTQAMKLPIGIRAPSLLAAASTVFQHGVTVLCTGNLSEAYKCFKECHQPLTQAEIDCRGPQLRFDALSFASELRELVDQVAIHSHITEARMAINQGDAVLDSALSQSDGAYDLHPIARENAPSRAYVITRAALSVGKCVSWLFSECGVSPWSQNLHTSS